MSDLLSGLGSALGGITDLLSGGSIFDMVGNALGLPPLITDAAKTVVGAMTGNVLLAVDGAKGLAQELSQNPPAATEYTPPEDSQQASDGYAQPASVHEATPVTGGTLEDCGEVSRSSQLDPKMNDYLETLRTLEQNFQTLDAMDGKLNGALSLEDLQRAAHDTRVSPQLREAAQFLVDNPAYFERLQASGGGSDGRVTPGGVKSELHTVRADFAQYGRPEREDSSAPSTPSSSTPSSSTSCSGDVAGSSMRDVINDPNLSLEEKINTILGNLTGKMDDEILQTMDDLTAAQDKKAGLTNSKGDEKALTQAQNDIDRISMRLQQLVEKRKTMFEMMSTLSMKFDEMAKTALSNMRSA